MYLALPTAQSCGGVWNYEKLRTNDRMLRHDVELRIKHWSAMLRPQQRKTTAALIWFSLGGGASNDIEYYTFEQTTSEIDRFGETLDHEILIGDQTVREKAK